MFSAMDSQFMEPDEPPNNSDFPPADYGEYDSDILQKNLSNK
jgi:hypothetical protein